MKSDVMSESRDGGRPSIHEVLLKKNNAEEVKKMTECGDKIEKN
jgi:hypothetical protein